jgi:hypothetical protein
VSVGVNPKLGERICYGACGSTGFVCEAFECLGDGREGKNGKNSRVMEGEFCCEE